MTHDEMIAVIQAHKAGKFIETKYKDSNGPWDLRNPGLPNFNFNSYDYRVKKEPIKCFVLVDRSGTARCVIPKGYAVSDNNLTVVEMMEVPDGK
jgi:hypothetical protein